MHKQRKLGAVLSYVAQFVHMLVSLVYTPVMLRLLGQSEYGLYQMVFSVVSYLNLLSFGFNSAYIRYYSRYKAVNDDRGIASLNGMFLAIFCCISVIATAAGGVMVANIRGVLGENLTGAELETARMLMILMVFNLAITFPTSVFDSYVTSQEHFVFQKLLVIIQQALSPIVTLPLLLLGYGSVAVITVTTVLTLLKLLVNIYYCLKKLGMKISFRGFRMSLMKEMWTFTFFIFLTQIIDQINWSVDKFLLGRYLGTVPVAVYGLASTVNNVYLHFSTAISNVFVPKVNALVVQENDNRKLTELFTRVGRVQFCVLALILIGFVSVGKPFMGLWGGKEYIGSYGVTLFLIIPVTVPLIQNLGIEIQRAKNMHRVRSVVYFLIAIGNIFLSIPLIQRFGAVGAAAGTAAALTVGNILFMNVYYHKKIGLNMWFFWKNIFAFVPALLLPCAVGGAIMCFATIENWLQLMLCAALIMLVYCFSVYKWGFNQYERELVRSFAVKLRKKGNGK